MSIGLAGLVDWIYVHRCTAPHAVSVAGPLLPQVTWTLGGAFRLHTGAGRVQSAQPPCVTGPSSAAMKVESVGPTVAVGVGLFPEGWTALIPCPASELADAGADLAGLWGSHAARPLDVDPDAPDAEIAAALNARLMERLARGLRPVDLRISAIAAWANGERTDIDALARRLDISHRHLSRLSQAAFGLGPRRLANKHRVLRLAVALSTEALADPSDAWTLGYADQSHFIRSFRQFMGVSPGRFAAEPHRFASEVMRARVEIASAHPLGLYLR